MSPLPRTHSSHGRLSPRVSFTSPTPSRRTAKRTHSNSACSSSYGDHAPASSYSSDPDPWRLAKRARLARTASYGRSATIVSNALPHELTASVNTPLRTKAILASSPAAFGLPSRPMRNLRRPRPLSPVIRTAEQPRVNCGEILDLNAQAFGELRSSITDGGEDFIQRMRNWETERLQTSATTIGGSSGSESPMQLDDEDARNDEEDIEIISSEPSSDDSLAYFSREPPHICFSRLVPASDTVEMEDAVVRPRSSAHIWTSPMRTRRNSVAAVYNVPNSKASSVQKRDREDRAIDALSLAMSTGAGGIRDYSAVRDVLGAERSAEAAPEVGSMWD